MLAPRQAASASVTRFCFHVPIVLVPYKLNYFGVLVVEAAGECRRAEDPVADPPDVCLGGGEVAARRGEVAAVEADNRGDAEVDGNDALGKIDGDALAAEFERYLRRRRPGFGR